MADSWKLINAPGMARWKWERSSDSLGWRAWHSQSQSVCRTISC